MAVMGKAACRAAALYQLEPMRLEDVPPVVAIERLCYSNPWPPEAFRKEIGGKDHRRPTIAKLAHSRKRVVVGYCVQWVTFGRLHVQNIAVHPQHRRCGLARYLLEDAFEAGRRAGCTKVLLEVRESNVPARRLYASLRFREVGRRKGYYAQPIEDAILYEKDLVSSRET